MILRLIGICLLLLGCSVRSDDLRGKVVKVADGDTITVLDAANNQHKIRLQGIDAPEKGQAFGDAAGRYLAGLVAGQEVRVTWTKRDKYNRILGTVYVNGEEVNLAMLRAGFAWHYKRFDSTPAYDKAEIEARVARRGLWADLDPILPEQFRHDSRAHSSSASHGDLSPSVSRVEYRAGNKMPVGSRTPAPVCDKWPDTGYWLSTNSNKRHNRNCENYRKTRGYPCRKNEGDRCGKCGG